jgi:hypothetical protein
MPIWSGTKAEVVDVREATDVVGVLTHEVHRLATMTGVNLQAITA